MLRILATAVVAGAVLVVASLAAAAPAAATGEAAAGQALYLARCGGCHSLDANRIGPAHRGVVGRRVASVPGYAYSPALKRLGGVWTPARLDQWLQGPQAVAPGARMFLTVGDPAVRRDIIAYLAANPATP
ncbi:MAG: c-type cytochrome [Sphingomonadaceae bacterium]|nr:c-type cytochrome [Sphingomonadaceae bacterium]